MRRCRISSIRGAGGRQSIKLLAIRFTARLHTHNGILHTENPSGVHGRIFCGFLLWILMQSLCQAYYMPTFFITNSIIDDQPGKCICPLTSRFSSIVLCKLTYIAQSHTNNIQLSINNKCTKEKKWRSGKKLYPTVQTRVSRNLLGLHSHSQWAAQCFISRRLLYVIRASIDAYRWTLA